MNLHEYQSKGLFSQFGIPVPKGGAVYNVQEALEQAKKLGTNKWVVKAQVHAGGRGKAGGVKVVSTTAELEEFVRSLIGKRLVTIQTDAHGQPINQVLIEEPCDIESELYLGIVIDRSLQKIVFMASTEGGVDIEQVAEETPNKIHKLIIDPLVGLMPAHARHLGFKLNLTKTQIKQFTHLLTQLYQLFIQKDLSLVEVNPLVITKQGDLLCLDAKINIDTNALYRLKDLHALHDPSQEDERETRARDWDLNYIPLEGDIGCMVNGAGLAMATMDLIKLHGGQPANFLDVGGGATKDRVAEALKIIIADSSVKGILVNIFGGIVRCDLIAEGILAAIEEVAVEIPVVVRLEGNNAELGRTMLNNSSLNITAANSLTDAAKKIISAVSEVVA